MRSFAFLPQSPILHRVCPLRTPPLVLPILLCPHSLSPLRNAEKCLVSITDEIDDDDDDEDEDVAADEYEVADFSLEEDYSIDEVEVGEGGEAEVVATAKDDVEKRERVAEILMNVKEFGEEFIDYNQLEGVYDFHVNKFQVNARMLCFAATFICILKHCKSCSIQFLGIIDTPTSASWDPIDLIFGAAGVVASSIGDGGRWWLLGAFSVSLFWTGAVFSNTVHVIVSGMVFLVLNHGGRGAETIPSSPVLKSLQYAITTSFGSICYGSLFTVAIRTLRWEIRGIRSKIGNNECLLCCVDFVFHIVETLVRFFNKYAYVQIAVNGKNFNHSARDAWELFQSTGVETLVAYDCSGVI